jgi:MFS family permease
VNDSTATAGHVQPVPRSRWYRIGLILFLIQLVAYMDRTNIGVAAPAMATHLGLSASVVGVLLSAFFWGYVITQVPGGWTAARIGPRRVIAGAMIVWGIGGLITALIDSYAGLLCARVLMGLAEGVVWPSFTVLVVNWFAASEQGRAMSLLEFSLPMSSVITAPLAGWMISAFDYHVMFMLQAIPAFVMAAVILLVARDHPADDRRISAAERDYLLASAPRGSKAHGSFLEVLALPRTWILGMVLFFWVSGLYSFGLWIPSAVSELSHRGIGLVGLISAIPFLFATAALYVNGRIADRPGVNRAWTVIVPLIVGGIALLAEHFAGQNLWLNMVLLVIGAMGIYAGFGPWWAWAASQVPHNQTGSAIGVINCVGNFGGVAGPVVVGLAAQGHHVSSGFYVLGLALLVGAVIVFALRRAPGAGAGRQPESASQVARAPLDPTQAPG